MDLFAAFLLLTSIFAFVNPITLPPPTGPFNVGMVAREITDISRLDPYSDGPEHRALMLTVFSPIGKDTPSIPTPTPYMPDAVATYYDDLFSAYGVPSGTFASLEMTTHVAVGRGVSRMRNGPCHPTILFSPGLGNSRLIYSTVASALAAQGFNVITIDHPHDGPVVVFPDGSVTTAADTNITSDAEIEKAFEVRTDDIVFVASHVADLLPRSSLSCRCGTQPLFAFGHSLGGAAAVDAVQRTKHLKASANLDGSLWGAENNNLTELSQPVLLFRSARNATIPSWQSAWPRISGSKLELELARSKHGTFTDFPFLVDALDFGEALGGAVGEMIGTIDGTDALRAVVEALAAWFGGAGGAPGWVAVGKVMGVVEGNCDLAVILH